MSRSTKTAKRSASIKGTALHVAVKIANFGTRQQSTQESEKQSTLRTLAQSKLLTDCIAAFLVSAGIGLLFISFPLFTFFEIGISTQRVLGLTGLSVALFALLRVRWWITPLCAAVAFGALYLTDTLSANINRWTEIAAWLLSGMPAQETSVQSYEMSLLVHSMICLTTLAVFILTRRFISVWFFVAAFAAALIPGWGLADTSRVLPASLFMTGIVLLFPRAHARRAAKAESAKRTRTCTPLFALPIAAMIVLLSLAINPPAGTYLRWRPLANTIQDVGRLMSPTQTEHTTNFEITNFGFGASPERLGGPVILSDGYILTVVANEPVLLRGSVLDYYTGYRWLPGREDGSFRFNGLFWQDYQSEAFDFNVPFGEDRAQWLFYTITTDVTLQITYANEFFNTIFSSAWMRDLFFSTPRRNDEIFFNARSELYITSSVPVGEVLTIHTRVLDREMPFFEYHFVRLEQEVYGDPYFAAIVDRYTILPESLPDIVRQTAAEIVGGETSPSLSASLQGVVRPTTVEIAGDEMSPFQKAIAIEQWLGENFRYTLDPVMPPEGVDFVAHFLETGEGYCVYYATAMAVMARTVGIPSRYVTGFALVRDAEQSNIFYATGRTAHAWAELYFYGIGWIPFDPLRWNADAPLNAPENPFAVSADIERWEENWANYWEMVNAFGATETGTQQIELFGAERNMLPYIIALPSVLLLGLALYLILSWNSKRRKYAPSKLARKIPDLTERFSFYYTDMMEQLRLMGMGINPGETLSAYAQRIGGQIAEQGMSRDDLSVITETQLRLHFAHMSPGDAEVETAGKFHAILEDKLQKKLSSTAYLWRRSLR